jgi:hypothetical protein
MTDIHDTPMWEDPQESSALRQLLRAGRVENSDYDVEAGLARHLAQLQAGAQLPAWAVQTTLQKSASWSLLAWVVPPVISAGVVGAWLALQPAAPAPPSLGNLVAAPNKAPAAALIEAAPVDVEAVPAHVEAEQPRTSEAKEPKRVIEEREVVREPEVVARNARPAARSGGARRLRSTRYDDAPSNPSAYAAVAQTRDGSGAGAGSGVASAKSANEEAATKAVVPVSPAAQELEPAPAPVEEANAKPAERRAKDAKEETSAKEDEVSGARLEREMRMLAVAQRVLTEDPARSLRLCRQGESEFRGSMFSAERKQVALLALVQLGKVEQARREGIPFLRAYPNAPWSARLREALSTGKLPNP